MDKDKTLLQKQIFMPPPCVYVCVPESCPGHNLAVHDGI